MIQFLHQIKQTHKDAFIKKTDVLKDKTELVFLG
jgi:hypothetical protein